MTDANDVPQKLVINSGPSSPTQTGAGNSLFGVLIGSGAAMAATAKYGFDVAKTALTERGKTRREQLRQDGQTDRARIAAASNAPAPAEPDDGPPEDDAATPGDAP